MIYSVSIKPFGQADDGTYIEQFDDSEMIEILDLFRRLGEKCQKTFNNLEEMKAEIDRNNNEIIVIDYVIRGGEKMSENDLLFYLESLTGYNSDNIINFDNMDYIIMGEPIIPKEKVSIPKEKVSIPKEKVSISKEKVSIPKEKVSISKEKVSISKEKVSIPKEKVSIPKEKVSIPKEKVSIPEEDFLSKMEKIEKMIQKQK
jgi:hypothetical protein